MRVVLGPLVSQVQSWARVLPAPNRSRPLAFWKGPAPKCVMGMAVCQLLACCSGVSSVTMESRGVLPAQGPSHGDGPGRERGLPSQAGGWCPGSPAVVPWVTGVPVLQDRKIAHSPFHTLTPAEREVFLARKKLLDYMGFQLRQAVLAKESQWDLKALYLSKRGGWPQAGRAAPSWGFPLQPRPARVPALPRTRNRTGPLKGSR